MLWILVETDLRPAPRYRLALMEEQRSGEGICSLMEREEKLAWVMGAKPLAGGLMLALLSL